MRIDSQRRPTPRSAGAALLVATTATTALLTGCTGSGSTDRPEAMTHAAGPTAITTARSTGVREVAVTDSAPKAITAGRVTEVATLPAPTAAQDWGFMALAPNGRLLVNVGPAEPDQGQDPVTYRSGVGLLDPHSGRLQTLVQPPATATRGPETHEGDVTGQSAVWNVGSSTQIDRLDFTLYGSSVTGGGTPVKVAASNRVLNGEQVSLPGGVNQPTILGNRVYWADATRPAGTKASRSGRPVLGISIYSRDLTAATDRRTEAASGWLPERDLCAEASGAPALSYLRSPVSDPSLTGRKVEVHRLIPAATTTPAPTTARTAADSVIWQGRPVRNGTATEATACGSSVALLGSTPENPKDPASLGGSFLTLYQPGGTIDFKLPDGTSVDNAGLTERWLAFSTYNGDLDGGQYLYDRPGNKLYQLPAAPGMQAVSLRGDYVSWSIPVRTKNAPTTGERSTQVGRLN